MSDARKPAGKVEVLAPEGAPDAVVRRKGKRRDGWTPRKRQGFLEAVARQATMEEAARGIGMSMTSVRNLRARDPVFDADCEAALAVIRPSLVEAAYQRAVVGVEEPVFQGGKLVGVKRRYSDSVLKLMIERGIDPAKPSDQVFNKTAIPGLKHLSQEEILESLDRKLTAMEKHLARTEAQGEAAEMEDWARAWHGGAGFGDAGGADRFGEVEESKD